MVAPLEHVCRRVARRFAAGHMAASPPTPGLRHGICAAHVIPLDRLFQRANREVRNFYKASGRRMVTMRTADSSGIDLDVEGNSQ